MSLFYAWSSHCIPVSKQDLWRAVFQRPTERVELFAGSHVSGTSEVNELDVEKLINYDVLILQEKRTKDEDILKAGWSTSFYGP